MGGVARVGLGREPSPGLFRSRQDRGRQTRRAGRPFPLGQKTLVAMAYDQRFWTAYVGSSGEGGAKLHRRDWGEIVENIANTAAYHWMAGNFLKYSGPLHANDPVDSHELIAMCAPRPVFISAGKGGYDAEPGGDSWVDAKGSFLAGAAAGPVYKLLGKKPVDATEFPPIETLVGGNADVAFRQHGGGHTDGPNWPFFLDFAANHLPANLFTAGPRVAGWTSDSGDRDADFPGQRTR